MTIRFDTALITGGSTGIGAALARLLSAQGTRVAICARRPEPLAATAKMLGADAISICADLSDPVRAQAVVDEAHTRLGSLDLVVANAGFGGTTRAQRLTIERVVPILQVNMIGACATITAAIPHMLRAGRGHLVGVSSLAGRRGLPTSAAYSASKAGLSVFLESLRADLFRTGVRVTDVQPGFVDTPLTEKNPYPMPFLMSSERAAEIIMAGVRRDKAVVMFPWQLRLAVWLLTLVPGAIYDRVASRASIPEKSP